MAVVEHHLALGVLGLSRLGSEGVQAQFHVLFYVRASEAVLDAIHS